MSDFGHAISSELRKQEERMIAADEKLKRHEARLTL